MEAKQKRAQILNDELCELNHIESFLMSAIYTKFHYWKLLSFKILN